MALHEEVIPDFYSGDYNNSSVSSSSLYTNNLYNVPKPITTWFFAYKFYYKTIKYIIVDKKPSSLTKK